MTKNLFRIAIALFFIASPAFVSDSFAVGMGMGMGMGPPVPCGGPFPPCPIPLDSGVAVLLLAGTAYGAKKLYDSTRKNPA